MGSSFSCSVGGSKGNKKIYPRKDAQKQYSNEKNSQRKHAFIWKINGFKLLLELGEAWTATSFEMNGFTWNLSVNPMDSKSGDTGSEKHLSLCLAAAIRSFNPDDMLETKFKFFIHDQKEGKRIEREASHTYMKPSSLSRTSWMIPLMMLKSPSLGFLVNDSIEVGVEFTEIKKLDRTCFIPKNKSSGLFRWYIDDFSKLSKPSAFSKPFEIAGYTWKLQLQPESVLSKHYVGLYLIMENKTGSKLPSSSGVMVQAIFYIKRQSQGILADDSLRNRSQDPYQYKLGYNFTPSGTSWGTREFISLEDFKNPSNGYLINGACTIEASVCIFGSGNDHSS